MRLARLWSLVLFACLALAGSLSAANAAPQSLRVAAFNNGLADTLQGPLGIDRHYVRWSYRIGSGNFADLRFAVNGWYLSAKGAVDTPAAYTIVKASLENSAGTISVPVTFGGNRSVTVNVGANDLQSDAILPGAFGLTKFSRGEYYWLKMEVEVAPGKVTPAFSGRRTDSMTGSQSLFSNSALTSVSDVDALGAFSVSGTKPVSRPTGLSPILLGHFESGDPATWFGAGDSNFLGKGDKATPMEGLGLFQRALLGDQTDGQVLAGLTAASPGLKMENFGVNPRTLHWIQYTRYYASGLGRNDFGANPKPGRLPTVKWAANSYWSQAYSNGALIVIQTTLCPRTKSTDKFATEASQTPTGAAWAAGGEVAQYNVWLNTIVGIYMDGVIALNSCHGVDPTRWPANGTAKYATANGTDPSALLHAQLGAELRAVMDLYP